MAARGALQAPRRPVTLRDFLEFGCDSSSDGFRSYPRRPPLVRPDATDDAVLQHLHLQQQQASPAPRAEPAPAQQLLRRSPSRSASSLSLSLLSSLSRSFSRRIKEGFWRRRDEEEEVAYFDDRDSCGFPSPLVSSCSASVSDESEYAAEFEVDVTTTPAAEETTPASERDKQATASTSSSSSSSSTDHDRTDDAAEADGKKVVQPVADGDSAVGRKKVMGSMVEDKQQQSPVSVLDFPFDDDDGEEEGSDAGTCSSPAFQFQRFTPPPPDLHGTKQQQGQLLHKIGRDGVVGIDPVYLDARFTAATSESGESGDASTRLATTTSGSSTDSSSSTETTATRHDDDDEAEHQSAERSPSPSPHHHQEQEEPDDEYRLLARLLEHDAAAAACLDDEVSRVLVLDFFAEGADDRRLICSASGTTPLDDNRSEAAAEALVGAAAEWLRGAGPRWGIGDVVLSGKAALNDMERSRRWMCVGEEQRDIGADVEGDVVDALLDELVTELGAVLPWWPRGGDMAVDEPGCARSLTVC